jgi:hypothetical protein
VLSVYHVLEALFLTEIRDVGVLSISLPTLRIIVIGWLFKEKGELIIKEAPRLERLLLRSPSNVCHTIRVISAPKLDILGPLSPCISEFEIANLVFEVEASASRLLLGILSCCYCFDAHLFFQGLIPPSSTMPIHTVKVLALMFSGPDLNGVLDILRCFPCLEKLCVIVRIHIYSFLSQNV